jgi:hypothetical protein
MDVKYAFHWWRAEIAIMRLEENNSFTFLLLSNALSENEVG